MSTTTKYGIRKHDDVEPLSDIGTNLRAALDRVDLLMGETGKVTITGMPAAGTTKSVRINYARSYATLAPLVPQAFVVEDQNSATTVSFHIWVDGEDATGFTVNIISSNAANRAIKWFCRF